MAAVERRRDEDSPHEALEAEREVDVPVLQEIGDAEHDLEDQEQILRKLGWGRSHAAHWVRVTA